MGTWYPCVHISLGGIVSIASWSFSNCDRLPVNLLSNSCRVILPAPEAGYDMKVIIWKEDIPSACGSVGISKFFR